MTRSKLRFAAHRRSQARFLSGSDPGIELAVNPAAGDHAIERLGRLAFALDTGAVGGGANTGMGFEPPVKLVEKIIAVVGVALPGVLAV
jgi:hypothetical protein